MATPPKSWFPWRRFQRAVGLWAYGALDLPATGSEVMWSDFNLQRPPLPYLALQVTSGPTRRGQDAEQWPSLYPSAITVTITPDAVAATGDIVNLFVNGELFTHTAAPADTVTIARDDLLAQIAASVQLGVTAATSGADAITLAADRPGSMLVVAAIGCTAVTTGTQLVAMTSGARELRVRATVYGAPEPTLDNQFGVAEWIELLTEGTQDPDLRLALCRQGFVFTRTQALQQRLTAPSGAEREPRAAVDLMLACDVRRGRLVTTWLDEVAVAVPIPVNPDDA